jgi:hypothetical protein
MKSSLVLISCFCLVPAFVRAGDAVAIGYNPEGVWAMVTYYASSTPNGGKDYKNSSQAREAALLDLGRRLGKTLGKADVISASDKTGFVAVARGQTAAGKDITVVGRGKSQEDAEKEALADLNQAGATAKQKIVYQYFSHGADSTGTRVPKVSARR